MSNYFPPFPFYKKSLLYFFISIFSIYLSHSLKSFNATVFSYQNYFIFYHLQKNQNKYSTRRKTGPSE